MKKIFTLLLIAIFSTPVFLYSQYSAGLAANFGLEGDILSATRINGSFNPGGTHDWFFKSGGGSNLGIGILDTNGAAAYKSRLSTGENYYFGKGMNYPRYSVQDGYLLLDGRYARDQFGLSNSGPAADKTSFQGGQKNGASPNTWMTMPTGGAVADKSDIIDGYVHFRRNGSTINGTSSSHLMAMFGISTLTNLGSRYFDIEFYSSRIAYDTTTGIFSNAGNGATGGHTVWEFNADGTIKKFGDMTISFAFNTTAIEEISVWMWVSRSDYTTLNPRDFDFVPGEFNGELNSSNYGYVKITPNTGSQAVVWGAPDIAQTSGPGWGTASKTLGSNATNYFWDKYDINQFAEGGIDLSGLGIDPAYLVNGNACVPVFTRVMFKSRSSASFTSSLQDFIGPYEFLDGPVAPATIASPGVLKCNVSAINLAPQTTVTGAVYNWTTADGNITSDPNQPTITVTKAGQYILRSAIVQGCPQASDTVVVGADYYQPVATASVTGLIDLADPLSYVTLNGGDVAASNFNTPYGGSAGLDWKWTGPLGFTSNVRNPTTTNIGDYTLELTESRNGCKDTAITVVAALNTLPVHLMSFQGNMNKNNKVTLNWTVADNETVSSFEVERSTNGKDFTTVAVVFGSEKTGTESYSYFETVSHNDKIMYRLKMFDKGHDADYSRILVFQTRTMITNDIKVYGNPVKDKLTFSYYSNTTQNVQIKVYDLTGKTLMSQKINSAEGSNMLSLPLSSTFKPGMYVVEVSNGADRQVAKFVKQ